MEWLQQNCDPNEMVTFAGVNEKLGTLFDLIDQLEEAVCNKLSSLQEIDELQTKDKAPKLVANVSPREVRVWCQLNTIEMHQKLAAARETENGLKLFMGK